MKAKVLWCVVNLNFQVLFSNKHFRPQSNDLFSICSSCENSKQFCLNFFVALVIVLSVWTLCLSTAKTRTNIWKISAGKQGKEHRAKSEAQNLNSSIQGSADCGASPKVSDFPMKP